ncbi:MAG: hypothetical protein QOF72_2332 [Blastocatellia bacterium]|nr:hypothetical protein [Blastocatellia bacterium]
MRRSAPEPQRGDIRSGRGDPVEHGNYVARFASLVSIYNVNPQLALRATDMPPAMRALQTSEAIQIKNMPPFYYKQDLETDKGPNEPSLGTTLNSISKSDKSAAVGAIINADPLAGDWTGSSGAGGLVEEWQIRNENGNWTVKGKWLRGNEEVGNFGGENYRYLNRHLTFTQVIDKPPIAGWTSGTKLEVWAEGNSMTFRWTTADGNTGTVTHNRKQ